MHVNIFLDCTRVFLVIGGLRLIIFLQFLEMNWFLTLFSTDFILNFDLCIYMPEVIPQGSLDVCKRIKVVPCGSVGITSKSLRGSDRSEHPPGHRVLTQEVLEIVEESGGQEAQSHSDVKK